MNPRIKKIIFSKLNDDLSKVEIILSENQSIWFIDRANKYWYFELEKSGKLWWRYEFFTEFFILFSLKIDEFQPLLSEWVEGIFDSNVNMTTRSGHRLHSTVEGILNHGYRKGSRKIDEVLNREVVTTEYCGIIPSCDLEKILNREINEIDGGELFENDKVEDILNREVNMTVGSSFNSHVEVEDMLNHKVISISHASENNLTQQVLVNDLLFKIESATPLDTPATNSVDEVLNSIVPLEIP